jgi:sugar-phosphatase
MDGVLVDSMPSVTRIYTQWAREHGFDPQEVVRVARGRPCLATVQDYLPHSEHQAEKQKIEDRELQDLEGLTPWPGACDLLHSLPIDRWAIVTSCTRVLAEARLGAAGLPRPRWFVTCSDVTHGKPHPEPYEQGAAVLGFAPGECVVVEDAPAGIRSGKAAGARVLALRTTAPEADLWNAGADWVVADCSSLALAENGNKLVLRISG